LKRVETDDANLPNEIGYRFRLVNRSRDGDQAIEITRMT
jgi:hypothetical protein